MEIGKISDAEYEIMEVVWKLDGEVTTADIIEGLGDEKTWKHTTILSLARRLVNKNILELRKENRINYYSPKISFLTFHIWVYLNFKSRLKKASIPLDDKDLLELFNSCKKDK